MIYNINNLILYYMNNIKRMNPSLFFKRNILGQYLLHQIAPSADRETIKYCICQNPDALYIVDYNGMLPIHIAVSKGNDEAAREMIKINPILGISSDEHGRTLSDLRDGYRSDSLWFDKENCCCNIM